MTYTCDIIIYNYIIYYNIRYITYLYHIARDSSSFMTNRRRDSRFLSLLKVAIIFHAPAHKALSLGCSQRSQL